MAIGGIEDGLYNRILAKFPHLAIDAANSVRAIVADVDFGDLSNKGFFYSGKVFDEEPRGSDWLKNTAANSKDVESGAQKLTANQAAANAGQPDIFGKFRPTAIEVAQDVIDAVAADSSPDFTDAERSQIAALDSNNKLRTLGTAVLDTAGWVSGEFDLSVNDAQYKPAYTDAISAQYAADAKGNVTAIIGEGDNYTKSVLFRVELDIIRGQTVNIDGVLYQNSDVSKINGISIESFQSASKTTSFEALQQTSHIAIELANKAVIGDSTAKLGAIEKIDFSNVVESIGKAADVSFNGDLNKVSLLANDPVKFLEALRSNPSFDTETYKQLTRAFDDHLTRLTRAGVETDPQYAAKMKAEADAARMLGGDGKLNAQHPEFDKLVTEIEKKYLELLDKNRITVDDLARQAMPDTPAYDYKTMRQDYDLYLREVVAPNDYQEFLDKKLGLMKIWALRAKMFLRDGLNATADKTAAVAEVVRSFGETEVERIADKIIDAVNLDDLGNKFQEFITTDISARDAGKYAVQAGGTAFEALDVWLTLDVIEAEAARDGLTQEQIDFQKGLYTASTATTAFAFGAGIAIAASIPFIGPVFAVGAAAYGGLKGIIGVLDNIKKLHELSNGEEYPTLGPLAESVLPTLQAVDKFLFGWFDSLLGGVLQHIPAVKMVGADAVHVVGEVDVQVNGETITISPDDYSEIAVGDGNAKIIGTNKNDWVVHLGAGDVDGNDGDDVLVGWFPDEIDQGQALDPQAPDGLKAEEDLSLRLYGDKGDDWIVKIGGEHATLVGGAGKDWIVGGNAELWGGEEGGTGDGEADDFWVFGGALVKDAEAIDTAHFAGMSLLGGVAFSWQEKAHMYWSPGGTALSFALGAFSSAAGTLSLLATTIDVIAGLSVRYGATEDGGLIAEFFAGRGGRAGFENYTINNETGEATAGIIAIQLEVSTPTTRAAEMLSNTISLIIKQSFRSQSVYSEKGLDPLILDLDGDGIEVGRYSAHFDLTGDGFAERADWVFGGDGLLARDLNGNGNIDDITELFGDEKTPGFTALGELDSNDDGVINASDDAFSDLRIWIDENRDGITDAGELTSLTAQGISSISLAANDVDTDVRGNVLRATSSFTRTDGTTGEIADVLLNADRTNTRWIGDATISAEAAATLAAKGYGQTKTLQLAATEDAALLAMVQSFEALSSDTSWDALRDDAEAIFLRWTGAADITASLIGAEFDTAKFAAMETWFGVELAPRDAHGAPVLDQMAIDQLVESFAETVDALTIRLSVQGPLSTVLSGVTYSENTDRAALDDAEALTALISSILTDLSADASVAKAEWVDVWAPLLNQLRSATDRADGVELRDDFIAASALAATEAVPSSLALQTLTDGLGIETLQIGDDGANSLQRIDSGLQVFVGGTGNDTLNGSGGQTVYVYGSEWGQDTIIDGERFDMGDRLRFATLTADDITLAKDGEDLVVTRNGSADTIRVNGQFGEVVRSFDGSIISGDYGVEEIQFKDGAIWDFTDIFQAVGKGTSSVDTLTGSDQDDWLEGLEGNDILEGGNGGDAYFYSAGHGADTIRDIQTDPLAALQDAIIFETGISFADFEVSRDGTSEDLVITFGPDSAATDAITIEGQFWYGPLGVKGGDKADGLIGDLLQSSTKYATDNRIEAFIFQDGPPLTWQQVQQQLIAQATSDDPEIGEIVYGFGSRDDFGASAGDDILIGFDGGDTYRFERGSGHDTIRENAKYLTTLGTDTIAFGAGISRSDVVFERPEADPHLRITIVDTGETLTVEEQFSGFNVDIFGLIGVQWTDRIERFTFEDGTVLTWEDVLGDVTTGNAGDNYLAGDHYADTLDGNAGNDTLSGRDDGDTYVVRAGEGDDIIIEGMQDLTTTAADQIVFEGMAEADVTFSRDANNPQDLVASFAGGGSATIRGQYSVTETWVFGDQAFNRIEEFVWTDGTKGWRTVEQDLITASKTSGDDDIFGTHYNDTLDGGGGNDMLVGGNGSDQYLFGVGGGFDVIDDRMDNILAGNNATTELMGGTQVSGDVLVFGAGLDFVDARFIHTNNDLTIEFGTVGSPTESVTIESMFAFFDTGPFGVQNFGLIEEIVFGEGTGAETSIRWVSLMQEILDQAKTNDDDVIEGFYFDDVLDGGAGTDLLIGGDGNDTYVFDVGYGHDTIREDRESIFSDADMDTVAFGAGVNPDDIRIARSDRGGLSVPELIITIEGNMQDSLTLDDTYSEQIVASRMQEIERFTFNGGTVVWDQAMIHERALQSSIGNDELIGFGGGDLLDGGEGNDLLDGRIGSDTYVFAVGYGHDIIEETISIPTFNGTDTVRFDGGIGPDDITLSSSSNGRHLVVTLLDAAGQPTGDTLTIRDQFLGNWYDRIERFEFSDAGNTVWNYEDISAAYTGTPNNDPQQTATDGNDELDMVFGIDKTMYGKRGDDTYLFGVGYGQDTVIEDGANNSTDNPGNDTIVFLDDLTLDDLDISYSGSITFTIANTGDSLSIVNAFGSIWNRVENFTLSERAVDGTLTAITYTLDNGAELGSGFHSFENALLALGVSDESETIKGFGYRADTIYGGGGDDTLIGYNGGDTYLWGLEDGHDRIIDSSGSYNGSLGDNVTFGTGIAPEDLRLVKDGQNLVVSVDGVNASLTIQGQLWSDSQGVNYNQIDEFYFENGEVWSAKEMEDRILEQMITDGDDDIEGFRNNEVIDGGPGDDTINGGAGGDIYNYGRGSGNDYIHDSHGTNVDSREDVVRFVGGLTPDDLAIVREGNSIRFTILDTEEELFIQDAFSSSHWKRIERYEFGEGVSFTWREIGTLIIDRNSTDGDDTIVGTSAANIIDGGEGNDTISAGAGNDIVSGGAGDDVITGGPGVVYPASDSDVLYGDAGDDTLLGGDNDDALYGGDGDDELFGGSHEDTLYGGTGDDLLSGGTWGDRLFGGDGDDILRPGDSFDEVIDGGAGSDTVDLSNQSGSTAVTIDLVDQEIRFNGAYTETLTSIENVIGSTNGANTIIGTNEFNHLTGGDAADVINGSGGDDTLFGGRGGDQLNGGDGDDWVNGGSGKDVFDGGDGIDTLDISGSSALLYQQGIIVDLSAQTIEHVGATGNVYASATEVAVGFENVSAEGVSYKVTLTGDDGDNRFAGGNAADIFDGGAGSDTVDVANSAWSTGVTFDLVQGQIIWRNASNAVTQTETLTSIENITSAANAVGTFIGNDSDNRYEGGNAADIVSGVAGNDTLLGGGGDDEILGGAGNDGLDGQDGDDLLIGGAGDDTLFGGDGSDTFRYAVGDGSDEIRDVGAGVDRLELTGHDAVSLQFYQDGDDLTVIEIASGNQLIRVVNHFIGSETGIEEIVFANSVVWDRTTIASNLASISTTGTSGDDVLTGTAGDDTLDGLAGDDVFVGDAGADTLLGNDGHDTVSFASVASGITVDLENVANSTGIAAGDTYNSIEGIEGGSGVDALRGDASGNTLTGNGGDDILDGRAGDDVLVGGAGEDAFNGGDGEDMADFSAVNSEIKVDLLVATRRTGIAEGDTFSSVENLNGGTARDWLYGDNGANILIGNDGNDILYSRSGNDTLLGGLGNDSIYGNAGVDTLFGHDGNDTLRGGADADVIDGGDGIDTVAFNDSPVGIVLDLADSSNNTGHAVGDININIERYMGSQHADTISGDSDANYLRGYHGDDLLEGRAGDDELHGENGNDTLDGGDGNDILTGGEGADTFLGGAGEDTASYSAVKTEIKVDLQISSRNTGIASGDTFSGIENLNGGSARDRFYGDGGANTLVGNGGNDVLYARSGNDTLLGGSGNDYLYGVNGDDFLFGGSGNDSLRGGAGADAIDGGSGTDTASYSSASTAITLDLTDGSLNTGYAAGDTFIEVERYQGSQHNDSIYGTAGVDYLRGYHGDDFIDSRDGNDRVYGENGDDTLHGGEGVDYLYGGNGDDAVFGDGGNDRIYGDLGSDVIDGGTGNDFVYYTNSAAAITLDLDEPSLSTGFAEGDTFVDVEYIYGSRHNDTMLGGVVADNLRGHNGNDTIEGRAGDDRLYGGNGDDTIRGGDGIDRLYGQNDNDILEGGAAVDYLYGGAGIDAIFGDVGNDYMKGEAGDDTLNGGVGNDRLFGGSGSDTFVFSASDGADIVYDFSDGADFFRFEGTGLGFGDLSITTSGANSNIDYGTGTINVRSVTADLLDQDDFVFV